VSDGEEALAFLQRQAPYREALPPSLILLDIQLLKKTGWEVLTVIRATTSLRTLPVVMLSGIMSARDEEQREALQPSECFVKPMQPTGYRSLST